MRCITDGHERSGGTVAVNGHDIGRLPPQACVALGIGRKFQTANVFDTLTVAECLRLARYRLDGRRHAGACADAARCRTARAAGHRRATGLDRQLAMEARHLSHGMKQALELAMVLALEPSVLLLDEPTAGLTKPERTLIGSILVDLASARGSACYWSSTTWTSCAKSPRGSSCCIRAASLLDGSVAEVVASELVRSDLCRRRRHRRGAAP